MEPFNEENHPETLDFYREVSIENAHLARLLIGLLMDHFEICEVNLLNLGLAAKADEAITAYPGGKPIMVKRLVSRARGQA